MTTINKKGRLFGGINIIDFLILLVVLLAIVFLFVKYTANTAENKQAGRIIQYKVELTLKQKDFADVIQTGDKIWDSIKGDYLGVIIDKKVMPSIKVTENLEKGEFVNAKVPDRFDILLTLEANGTVTPGSILAEGIEIKVGQRVYIKGKGYASPGYILDIKYE